MTRMRGTVFERAFKGELGMEREGGRWEKLWTRTSIHRERKVLKEEFDHVVRTSRRKELGTRPKRAVQSLDRGSPG